MEETMTTYAELNRKYLREADDLLRKHDLPHASEKLWGAFVDAIKAVAERRGRMLGAHRSIAQFVLELGKEYPELRLHHAFRHAEGLHTNFFEDQLPEESVRLSVEVVKATIESLQSRVSF
jgi:hypothetical protein